MGNGFHLMYEELAMRHLYTCSSHDDELPSSQDPLLNDDGIRLRNEVWLKRLEEFIKVRIETFKQIQ